MLVVLGLAAVGGCKGDRAPKAVARCDAPSIAIVIEYPGASAAEVEAGVVLPLEQAVDKVRGATGMYSVAREGRGELRLSIAGNVDEVLAEAKVALDGVAGLPAGALPPVLFASASDDQTVLVAVSGDLAASELYDIADTFRATLEAEPDIVAVERLAAGRSEIEITVSADRLRALDVTREQIAASIRGASVDVPAGSVRRGNRNLVAGQRGSDIDQIRDVVLDQRGVRVGDIAAISRGTAPLVTRVDGRPAVLLAISGAARSDAKQLAAIARRHADISLRALPDSVSISVLDPVTVTACAPVSSAWLSTPRLQGAVLARAVLPAGTEPEDVDRVLVSLEAAAKRAGAHHVASANGARLFPALPGYAPNHQAFGEVALFGADGADATELAKAWRANYVETPEVAVTIQSPRATTLIVEIVHADMSVLRHASRQVAAVAMSKPGLVARVIDGDLTPDLEVQLSAAGRALGVTEFALARAVRAHRDGVEVMRVQEGATETSIVLRTSESFDSTAGLARLPIRTPQGTHVPLGHVASITTSLAAVAIHRVNGHRALYVAVSVEDSSASSTRNWLRMDVAKALEREHADLAITVQLERLARFGVHSI